MSSTPAQSRPVFHVPLAQLAAFREQPLVVRARDPRQLVRMLEEIAPTDLRLVQLLGPPDDMDALRRWRPGLPVDLVVEDPARDPGQLYGLTALHEDHPLRITIPVVAGFDTLTRLAVALGFSVKLAVEQPPAARLAELMALLDYYLHNATVAAPVEFFHSLLGALLHRQTLDLWEIQEEDPLQCRWVDEQGRVSLPGRLATEPADSTLADLQARLAGRDTECRGCAYRAYCGGFFKWPDPDYRCTGVRKLLGAMDSAIGELGEDLAAYPDAVTPS